MTNTKTTKRALWASVLSIVMCFAMLIGSTFAWFTDSATTGTNVIKSGNLDIGFEYADGKENPDSAKWENAEKAKIFDYALWEPGYTVAKHIKISNMGSLALKYQVSFKLDGAIGKLAEAIDVYFVDPASAIATRNDVDNLTSIGTLDKYLTGDVVFGDLEAGKSNTVTVVLKMKEEANNNYQNKSVGDGLTIVINATQDTVESDSFDNQYDKGAMLPDEKLVVTDDATLTEAIATKKGYMVTAETLTKNVVADGVKVTVDGAKLDKSFFISSNGGELIVENASNIKKSSAAYLFMVDEATVTINDGVYEFASLMAANIQNNTSVVNINGGTFKGSSLAWPMYPVSTINITGGTFNLQWLIMSPKNEKVTITGGTFSVNPSSYVPEGYKATKNTEGMWVVTAD